MTTNTEKINPTIVLRVELIEVLYVPKIWHDVSSFVARRTHSGWQRCATQKGPSQQEESDAI
jgi:5-methylthioribose kinase